MSLVLPALPVLFAAQVPSNPDRALAETGCIYFAAYKPVGMIGMDGAADSLQHVRPVGVIAYVVGFGDLARADVVGRVSLADDTIRPRHPEGDRVSAVPAQRDGGERHRALILA